MKKTQYTLHDHYRKKARRSHWDLRIVRPDGRKAWSFALPKSELPKKGKRLLAIKTPDHKLSIMDLEGKLHGKHEGDTLKIIETGECQIVRHNSVHITILFKGKILNGLFAFVELEDDNWLMIASK